MADIKVGIIMGSQSDWPTMKEAANILDELGVEYEAKIVSAHRTPDRLWSYGKSAADRGLQVIIAGSRRCGPPARHGRLQDPRSCCGRAGPDPGAVRCRLALLDRADAQGFPSPPWRSAPPAAANAGLMAAGILALQDADLAQRLDGWRDALSASIPEEPSDD